MKLAEVNALSVADFESAFGEIAEHSKWVASKAFASKPFATCEEMIAAFQAAVMNADQPAQLALLNAHPDLATRAKLASIEGSSPKRYFIAQIWCAMSGLCREA